MSTSSQTPLNAPDEGDIPGHAKLPRSGVPAPRDPRSLAAMDGISVEDQAGFLDLEFDDLSDDGDARGRSFADDVRSDRNDDERRERR